jgi:hypothetical protein
MTNKWDEMTLTEKSKAYSEMRDRFPDKGDSSASAEMIQRLCEMGIPASSDAIPGIIRGDIPIDKIKLPITYFWIEGYSIDC